LVQNCELHSRNHSRTVRNMPYQQEPRSFRPSVRDGPSVSLSVRLSVPTVSRLYVTTFVPLPVAPSF